MGNIDVDGDYCLKDSQEGSLREDGSGKSLNKKTPSLPAEEGVWLFILGDMFVFSLFFLVFIYYRAQDLAVFSQSQQLLNLNFGALNTLLLLSSSWFVAMALRALRNNECAKVSRLLIASGSCGLGFVVIKFFEYGEKIQAGYTLTSNNFFMYYYIFTGIHFLHLVVGLGVLLYLWARIRRMPNKGYTAKDVQAFEGGAAYWHMVDLLWIVLFPLIYLVK